jgi:8-oxo-dGTP pyrophosphatase MutT (NUDIX family)
MSNYIMDLRKIVGHRTLLQVGASVIVEDSKGRILLQKRSDHHSWGYAGGAVALDEKVEDAAVRELFEETGLKAESLELLGVYSGKDMHNTYPNGDDVSNVDIVYVCRKYSGELKRQESEVEDIRFFAVDELPDNIFKPNLPAILDWLELRKSI